MEDEELYNRAMSRAMALCSGKEQCLDDIRVKLASWSVGEAAAEKILAELVREKFIDESRYAGAFARDKFRYNKWGKLKIAAQLKNKRIPASIIMESLESIDQDSYTKLLKDLLAAQQKKIKARSEYELKGKLLRYALSKGYESGLVFEALEKL